MPAFAGKTVGGGLAGDGVASLMVLRLGCFVGEA
jgi:hypothetical protein